MRRKRATGIEAGQTYMARVAVVEELDELEPPPAPALCPLHEVEVLMSFFYPGLMRLGISAGPRMGLEMVDLGPLGTAWLEPEGWWWEPPDRR
jgi:hypothetical protein